MKVPFLDLNASTEALAVPIRSAVERVIASGWYIGGPEVAGFEAAWADYCGAKHCVGLGNGLDALELALKALDIGPGHEVIVPSNGYIATWLAVSAVGATPVPVEPDPLTHNLDPERTKAAVTSRTRAILPIHLYGQPADINPLAAIANDKGLALVEDAAQAHGARYRGSRIGGHGRIVCWSFYPSKNLGALGDGGAITTNDEELADRIRTLGNYGSKIRYVNEERGVNSRLDPLQAAVLGVKLANLDEWNARRAQIAATYAARLADCDLILPSVPSWAKPCWHLFVVRSRQRDGLAKRLAERGVQTLIHYPIPPQLQRAYADLGLSAECLPVAEQLAKEVLSLPIGPQMTDAQVEMVCDAVRECTE